MQPFAPGFSIIIPERASHEILCDSLDAAVAAASMTTEPWEVIVVVNGSPSGPYTALQAAHPQVQWRFFDQVLWYLGAVREGLALARYDWVYLLNNDMVLQKNALEPLLQLRRDREKVFSVASQVFFSDASRRREETGWTSYKFGPSGISIADDIPPLGDAIRGTLYSGGGAALFRKDLLLKLMSSSDVYAPFYWEDVEWGWRAWLLGFASWFCPASLAFHAHRQTNRKLFSEPEIDRIMQRNARIFELRNGPRLRTFADLERILGSLDAASREELLEPERVGLLARGRFEAAVISAKYREPGPVWQLTRS